MKKDLGRFGLFFPHKAAADVSGGMNIVTELKAAPAA
jgi:hypothetical protein